MPKLLYFFYKIKYVIRKHGAMNTPLPPIVICYLNDFHNHISLKRQIWWPLNPTPTLSLCHFQGIYVFSQPSHLFRVHCNDSLTPFLRLNACALLLLLCSSVSCFSNKWKNCSSVNRCGNFSFSYPFGKRHRGCGDPNF